MDDDITHLFRVLEIINRIINGWFIYHCDIESAKKDVKKELLHITENKLVKAIIKNSILEKKDPRNKQVNIDSISKNDLYVYCHKNYRDNNSMVLIQTKLNKKDIQGGINLILCLQQEKIKSYNKKFLLNWEDLHIETEKNYKNILLKSSNNIKQDNEGFIELFWLKWAIQKCLSFTLKTDLKNIFIMEILFSPFETLFWLKNIDIKWNKDLLKKIDIILNKGYLVSDYAKDNFYHDFINIYFDKYYEDKILLREKEFIYDSKLIIENLNYDDAKKYINQLNMEELENCIRTMFLEKNILAID